MTTNTSRFSRFSERSQHNNTANIPPEVKLNLKTNDARSKNGFPVLQTKQTTFTMAAVVRSILKEQRLANTPASSDSRYISNLIYKDRFGIDLYGEDGEQLFEIDPKTGEKIEN